jgi:hypothetical protein
MTAPHLEYAKSTDTVPIVRPALALTGLAAGAGVMAGWAYHLTLNPHPHDDTGVILTGVALIQAGIGGALFAGTRWLRRRLRLTRALPLWWSVIVILGVSFSITPAVGFALSDLFHRGGPDLSWVAFPILFGFPVAAAFVTPKRT